MASDTSLMLEAQKKIQDAQKVSQNYNVLSTINKNSSSVQNATTNSASKASEANTENGSAISKFYNWYGNTALGKFEAFGQSLTEGFMNGVLEVFEQIGDLAIGLAGGIGSALGNDDQWAKDAIAYDWSKEATKYASISSVGKMIQVFATGESMSQFNPMVESNPELANQIEGISEFAGELAPSIILAVATGGQSIGAQIAANAGLATVSGAGAGVQSSIEEGNELGASLGYGGIKGAVQGLETAASIGIGGTVAKVGGIAEKAGTAVGEKVMQATGKEGLSIALNKATEIGLRAASEGVEEGIEAALDPFIQQITINSNAIEEKYGTGEIWNEVKQAAIQGAALSAVMDGVRETGTLIANGKEGYLAKYYQDKVDALNEEYKDLTNKAAKGKISEEELNTKLSRISDKLEYYNTKFDDSLSALKTKIEEKNNKKNKVKTEEPTEVETSEKLSTDTENNTPKENVDVDVDNTKVNNIKAEASDINTPKIKNEPEINTKENNVEVAKPKEVETTTKVEEATTKKQIKSTTDSVKNIKKDVTDSINAKLDKTVKSDNDQFKVKFDNKLKVKRMTTEDFASLSSTEKTSLVNKIANSLADDAKVSIGVGKEAQTLPLKNLLSKEDYKDLRSKFKQYTRKSMAGENIDGITEEIVKYFNDKIDGIKLDYKRTEKVESYKNSLKRTIKGERVDFNKETLADNAVEPIANNLMSAVSKSNSFDQSSVDKLDTILSNYNSEKWNSQSEQNPTFSYNENLATMISNFKDSLSDSLEASSSGKLKLTSDQLSQYHDILYMLDKTSERTTLQNREAQARGNAFGKLAGDEGFKLTKGQKFIVDMGEKKIGRNPIPKSAIADSTLGGTPIYKPMYSDPVQAKSNSLLIQKEYNDVKAKIDKQYRKFAKKKFSIPTSSGSEIKVNAGEMTSVYLNLKYEQGNIDKSTFNIHNKNKTINLVKAGEGNAKAYLDKIEKLLSTDDLKAINAYHEFSNSTEGLKGLIQQYLGERALPDNTFNDHVRIKRESDFTTKGKYIAPKELKVVENRVNSTKNMYAYNYFDDLNETIQLAANGVSIRNSAGEVVGMSLNDAINNYYTTLNAKTLIRDNGKVQYKTVAKILNESDENILKNMNQFIENTISPQSYSSALDKLRGVTARMQLAINFGTPLKQPLSALTGSTRLFDTAMTARKLNSTEKYLYNSLKEGSGYLATRGNTAYNSTVLTGGEAARNALDKVTGAATRAFDKSTVEIAGARTISYKVAQMLDLDADVSKISKDKLAEAVDLTKYLYEVDFNSSQIGSQAQHLSDVSTDPLLRATVDYMQGANRAALASTISISSRSKRIKAEGLTDAKVKSLRETNVELSKKQIDLEDNAKVYEDNLYKATQKKLELENKRNESGLSKTEKASLTKEIKAQNVIVKQADVDYHNAREELNSLIGDIRTNEAKIKDYYSYKVSGGKSAIPRLGLGMAATAIMVKGIDDLNKRLKGYKDIDAAFLDDDETTEEFIGDLALTTVTQYLPGINQVYNAIKNDSEISDNSLALVNDTIEAFQDIGDKNTSSVVNEFAILGSTMAGIPLKNMERYVLGAMRTVDMEQYLKTNEILFDSSSNSTESSNLKNYVSKGNTKKANEEVGFLMETYKSGKVSSELQNELTRLVMKGNVNLPSSVPSKLEIGDSTIELTGGQSTTFKTTYSKSNSIVSKLISSKTYKNLDDESKGKAIKMVYDAYYQAAKSKVSSDYTPNTTLGYIVSYASKFDASKFASVICEAKTFEGTETQSKKSLVTAYVNTTNLTKQEKLLTLMLCGYSLSDDSKTAVKNYLISKGMTQKQAEEIVN